jgi:hypothetical protein
MKKKLDHRGRQWATNISFLCFTLFKVDFFYYNAKPETAVTESGVANRNIILWIYCIQLN